MNEVTTSKPALIEQVNLSADEKADLIAFLESLSGEQILTEEPDYFQMQPLPAVANCGRQDMNDRDPKPSPAINTELVNPLGDSSIRAGALGQKGYNARHLCDC